MRTLRRAIAYWMVLLIVVGPVMAQPKPDDSSINPAGTPNTPSIPAYGSLKGDTDSTAYIARVSAAGGVISDVGGVNSVIAGMKALGVWGNLVHASSPSWGVHKTSTRVDTRYCLKGNDFSEVGGAGPIFDVSSSSNPTYGTITSGTATQVNMRLSLDATTAFIDINAVDLATSYLGKYVGVRDNAGKWAFGWIRAAGSGAFGTNVGSNLVAGWDFTSGWVATYSSTITNATTMTGTTGSYIGVEKQSILTSGACFKGSLTGTPSAGTLRSTNGNSDGAYLLNGASGTYFTAYSTDPHFMLQNFGTSPGQTFSASVISVYQVLGPSSTGVTIFNAATGGSQGWGYIDASFNRNDTSGYTYVIYEPSITVPAEQYNGSSMYLKQKPAYPGVSVTQAQAKASMTIVAGVGSGNTNFWDDSGAGSLASYAGADGNTPYILVVKDATASKIAWGYIGRKGQGEVISGTNSWTNGDFSSGITGWTLAQSSPNSEFTEVAAANTHGGGGTGAGNTYSNGTGITVYQGGFTAGGAYYVTYPITAKLGNVAGELCDGAGAGLGRIFPNAVGTYTTYLTLTANTSLGWKRDGATDHTVDNVSAKQVTEPNTTGVLIYNTKNGTLASNSGWVYEESGFDRNATGGYSYEVYRSDLQTPTSLSQFAWINAAPVLNLPILAKGQNATPARRAYFLRTSNITANQFNLGVYADGTTLITGAGIQVSQDSTWHMAGATIISGAGGGITYLDAVAGGSPGNPTGIYDASPSETWIGQQTALGYFGPGKIGAALIFNRVLTPTEITGLYNLMKGYYKQ